MPSLPPFVANRADYSNDDLLQAATDWLGPQLASQPWQLSLIANLQIKTLVAWPHGNPQPLTAIVSSRLPGRHDNHPNWFRALRQATALVGATGGRLLIVDHTTTGPWLPQLSRRLKTDSVHLVDSQHDDWEHWQDKLQTAPVENKGYLSPLIGVLPNDVSYRDLVNLSLADRIIVLSRRAGGRIDRLLSQLDALAISADLVDLGISPKRPHLFSIDEDASSHDHDLCGADVWCAGSWLSHWTRSASGPWPSETQEQYRDNLLLERQEASHNFLDSLNQILDEQRLRASAQAIRGQFPVVCLTQRSPVDWPAPVYRRHRHRWDFVPCGLAIRREAIERFGGRPVCYARRPAGNAASSFDDPFFQSTAGRIDWEQEQEWRVVGDIDLTRLDRSEAVVFVPHARWLPLLRPTRFPVVGLQHPDSHPTW